LSITTMALILYPFLSPHLLQQDFKISLTKETESISSPLDSRLAL